MNNAGGVEFPEVDLSSDTSLVSSILRHPASRLAVVGRGVSWTYADLAAETERIAGRLRSAGVGRGDLVVLHGSRSPLTIATTVATLLLGAGTVPVDSDAPETRLEEAVRICQPRAVADTMTGAIRSTGAQSASYERPGHVVFTSGSTGDPKPILVSDSALSNHAAAFAARLGLTAEDRALQSTGIDFDVAAEEVFPTLVAGGTVVVLEPALGRIGFKQFYDVLSRCQVSVCNVPASYFRRWAAALDNLPAMPPSVRIVVTGSETVPLDAAARWIHQEKAPRLYNAYGVSEATITSLMHEVCAHSLQGTSLPIGTPLAGVKARIVDSTLEDVPPGNRGELLLGGLGIADEYLGRDSPSGFLVTAEGEKWYRTGDQARVMGDQFFHEGRIDDQIKIRGHRIEPLHISSVMMQIPGIEDAVTFVADGLLVSSYTSPTPLAEQPIRAALRHRLPAEFLPDLLCHHSSLPRTTGGKIDFATLRRQINSGISDTRLEPFDFSLLMSVLGQVAPHLEMSADRSFLSAGGSSLDAAALVSEVNSRCGRVLTVEALYLSRSLRELARQANQAPAAGAAPVAEVMDIGGGVRASVRAMLEATRESTGRHYEWTEVIELEGPVQFEALARAVDAVVDGHPALRSRFTYSAQGWERSIAPRTRSTPVVDRALVEVLQCHRDLVLDLTHEQPLVADVVRSSSGGALLITSHHAVADGYASGLIAECISAHYALFTSQVTSSRCRTHDQSPQSLDMIATDAARQLAVARHQRTCTTAEWTSRALAPPTSAEVLPLDISATISGQLSRATRREQVTLTAALLAAFGQAITSTFKHPRVVVGLPVDSRLQEGAADVVGEFTNTAFVGVQQAGSSWSAAHQAHADLLESRQHQLVHHEELRSLAGLEDVFDFRLAVTGTQLEGLRGMHLGESIAVRSHQAVEGATTRRRLNLRVTVDTAGKPCRYNFLYDPARISGAELRTLARIFAAKLEELACS